MSQVILFDLDGTLTESGEGITRCVQYALEKMGIIEDDLEKLRCFVGPPLKEQFMSYAALSQEQAEQAVDYYRERYTTTGIFENKLYPKISDLLEILKINDKIMGVATSKPEKFARQILEYFGIDQYFQVIVGSEMDGRRTNKAEVIEEALVRLHMENERDKVLMVGDKEHDVLGAKSCGIQCVGVAYGYGTRQELEEAGAVYIADTVDDLGILASPNDEETTEYVESVRKHSHMKKEKKENVSKTMAPKVSESKEKAMHPAVQIWRMIYPVLMHGAVSVLMTLIFAAYFSAKAALTHTDENPFLIAQKVVDTTLIQLILTSLAAGAVAYFFYIKDQRKRREGLLGTGADTIWTPPVVWFSVIVLAIVGSQFLNDLIIVFHLNEIFSSYQDLVSDTMMGQPMWILFLAVGILAPIAEELIFRGLVFRRMKDSMKPIAAIILSSLFFGLYHGNMVQFLYASLLGIVLAIIYNRTGTLWTAIVAHMAANLWSMFGGEWWYLLMQQLPCGIFIGIIMELLLCVIPAYWLFANKRK